MPAVSRLPIQLRLCPQDRKTHFVIGSRSASSSCRLADRGSSHDRFGSPAAVFESSSHSLESAGLRRETIDAIKSSEPREKAAREIEELVQLDGEALTLASERYPKLLRETYDPPIVIYCLGGRGFSFLTAGDRDRRFASMFNLRTQRGRETLARPRRARRHHRVGTRSRNHSAAHRGALDGRGLTVGVMGTGLDAVYPKENRKLAARIAEQGVLVTEFPLATPRRHRTFRSATALSAGSRWV